MVNLGKTQSAGLVLTLLALFIMAWPGEAQAPNLAIKIDADEPPDVQLIVHDEIEYNSDSLFVKRSLEFNMSRPSPMNFSKQLKFNSEHITGDGKTHIWDYSLLLDNNDDGLINEALVIRKPFIEGKKSGDKWIYRFPEFQVGPTKTHATEIYRIKDSELIDDKNSSFWFPFDSYKLNYSLRRTNLSLAKSVKITLPRTLEADYSPSRPVEIVGVNWRTWRLVDIPAEFLTGPQIPPPPKSVQKEVGNIVFVTEIVRPVLPAMEGDRRTLTLPPVPLPPTWIQIPQGYTDTVTVSVTLKRPSLDRSLFWIPLAVQLILLSFVVWNYYTSRQLRTEYLWQSAGIWFFQEGVHGLLPSIRPPAITLFDLTILPVIAAFLLLSTHKAMVSANARRKDRSWRLRFRQL